MFWRTIMKVTTETLVTYNGETKTLAQWSIHFGYFYKVLYSRYKRGLRDAELFAKPRAYKPKDPTNQYQLPKNHTQRETLLCALDDYYRDHVMQYSKQFDVSEWELVTVALDRLFKRIQAKQADPNPDQNHLT